jgi:hypothetical protein
VAECCALVRGREQMTVRVLRTRIESAESALGAEGAARAGAKGATGAEGAEGARARRASGASGGHGAGARYLAERAAARTPPEIAPFVAALRDVHRATRVEPGRHDDILATVYHLIDRGSSDRFREQVELAAATMPHLILRVSGPMPAYAFATLSESYAP